MRNFINSKILNMSEYRHSFPSSLRQDVDAACRTLEEASPAIFRPSAIINGEKIKIPYRVYLMPKEKYNIDKCPQDTIRQCLYSRHHNGYVRERNLLLLLNDDSIEYFTLPYILKLAEEYVLEMVVAILTWIKTIKHSILARFLNENPLWLEKMDARSMSYWNLTYRRTNIFSYKDYPGAQLVSYLKNI